MTALQTITVRFLGTSGWYDSPAGNTLCILLDSPEAAIVLDAGFGIAKLDRHLAGGRSATLLLSHFHLDHVAGLHVLAKFTSLGALQIGIPEETRGALSTLVNEPFTVPLHRLPFPVEILELPKDAGHLPVPVSCEAMTHPVKTLGFRIRMGDRIIAYVPDTGPCAQAVSLAREADLLIAECAFQSGEDSSLWPHLNPVSAARIAAEAGARRLALVHFDASRYPDKASRLTAERAAREIFADTFVAMDDMAVEI